MGGIILVGVDNSRTALLAAEKAATYAVALDLELRVVSAYDRLEAGRPRLKPAFSSGQVEEVMGKHSQSLARLRDSAQGVADSVVETLQRKFPTLDVKGSAIEGDPGPALIRASKELDVDMVVVGNRNVQGFGRLLGSVATTVARQIDCDLHIVNTSH